MDTEWFQYKIRVLIEKLENDERSRACFKNAETYSILIAAAKANNKAAIEKCGNAIAKVNPELSEEILDVARMFDKEEAFSDGVEAMKRAADLGHVTATKVIRLLEDIKLKEVGRITALKIKYTVPRGVSILDTPNSELVELYGRFISDDNNEKCSNNSETDGKEDKEMNTKMIVNKAPELENLGLTGCCNKSDETEDYDEDDDEDDTNAHDGDER